MLAKQSCHSKEILESEGGNYNFIESKNPDVPFLKNDKWVNHFAFLTITKQPDQLNIKLQGKNQLVNTLDKHIILFERKL